jgi:hypothetical protein
MLGQLDIHEIKLDSYHMSYKKINSKSIQELKLENSVRKQKYIFMTIKWNTTPNKKYVLFWGCSSMVECLPSILKVLVWSLAQKKNKVLFQASTWINLSVIFITLNKRNISGHWWLMPVILATLEAEKGRIMVWGQMRQIVRKTPSQK